MQVTEILHDGLKRTYVITLPAARITGLRDERLTEIARSVPMSGFRRGEAPWAAVMQRFGTSVLGEVVEAEVAGAVRELLATNARRPAQEPAIVVGAFAEDTDLTIEVAFEELPEVPLPNVSGQRFERLRAQPGEPQLRQALDRLAARHGTLEEIAPRPATAGDILICDIEGGLPVDLLTNGAGRGARAGTPGQPPMDWSIDPTPGLDQQITAVGIEDGLPCFDLVLRGRAEAGAFLRVFVSRPAKLKVTAGTMLTLCMRARVVAGALPDGSSVLLGINERTETGFLRSRRLPASLGPEEMRRSFALSDDPALAYARPMLEIGFKQATDVAFTLRIGAARVFAGDEPAALLFGGGSMAGEAIEIGGPAIAPGFSPQLEGLAPGETRVVQAMLPANHPVNELANQRVRYVVTATALRRRRPLAENDTLARAVGLADGAALEAATMRSLRHEYDQRSRHRLKMALFGAVAASADFPVPECLWVAELAQISQRMRTEHPDAADAGKDEAELQAEYRALAERRIRLRLLIGEVARAHGLQVTEEEMAEAIRQDAARYPGQERQVLDFYRGNDRALAALRAPLIEEKVVDLLLGQATVIEREVTPEELGAGG